MRLIRLTGRACAASALLASVLLSLSSGLRAQHDHDIPAFDANPTIRSVRGGMWNDRLTWQPARVPNAADVVAIEPGHLVRMVTSDGQARTIGVRGTLAIQPLQSVTLEVETLLVRDTGTLQIQPVGSGASAHVVFRDAPLDPADTTQIGHGLIVLGRASVRGAAKTPFLRLAEEPLAGERVLRLSEAPQGWRLGDRIALPDTRHEPMNWDWWYAPDRGSYPWRDDRDFQWEERRVAAVNGSTVTLDAPLRFDHRGARDSRGALRYLPHVANLSRNVSFRSENPAGVRAHGIVTGHAFVDLRWCAFVGMGRTTVQPHNAATNPIGRYALHRHMNEVAPDANGRAAYLVGVVIDGSPRWGIAIHGSDATLVQDCIAYNCAGAGFVTEDASESFNTFERCFALRSIGFHGPSEQFVRNITDEGFRGSGFWFRGGNNEVRDCVAASTTTDGFIYWSYNAPGVWLPRFPGARRGVAGESDFVVPSSHKVPFRGFANNEMYGVMQTGVSFAAQPDHTPGPFVAWHVRCGFNEFLSHNALVRNSVFVGSAGKPMVAYGNGANFGTVGIEDCVFENLTAERGNPFN